MSDVRIGIIACSSMKEEIEHLIARDRDIAHLEFLPFGLHADPAFLRKTIVGKANALAGKVDALLIGYGRCQSLESIAEEIAIPAITLDAPDCIGIMLTPEEYDRERRHCAGTWFATPGWKDATAGFIMDGIDWTPYIKDMGYDPEQFVRVMFAGYSRCLFIDTGVGDREGCRRVCHRFCAMLSLEYEERQGNLYLLENALRDVRIKGGSSSRP